MVANRDQLNNLLKDPEFRRAFVADYVQEILAAQVRAIRESREWRQEDLGHAAGDMTQAQVSRLENPDYSGATINSVIRLAQAFDLGLIVKFAPFSEFVEWVTGQTPERLVPAKFDEELLTTANVVFSSMGIEPGQTVGALYLGSNAVIGAGVNILFNATNRAVNEYTGYWSNALLMSAKREEQPVQANASGQAGEREFAIAA